MINNVSTNFYKTLYEEKHQRLDTPHKDNIVFLTLFRVGSFLIAMSIPVIGICMHVVYKDDRPKDALYPLVGTLLSLLLIVTFTTLLIISQAYEFNGIPALQELLPEWANDFLIPFPRTLPRYTF